VGLLEDRPYDETEFQTEPGDVVLLYSDGVQDQLSGTAEGKEQRDYGTKRLAKLLKKMRSKPRQRLWGGVSRSRPMG
jgi:serine phosphatase RsbU (regulator of sigma subunit)